MEKEIKTQIDKLYIILSKESKHFKFSDRDLQKATVVFAYIAGSKIWDKLNDEDKCDEVRAVVAKTFGSTLYDLVKLHTGVDLQEVE